MLSDAKWVKVLIHLPKRNRRRTRGKKRRSSAFAKRYLRGFNSGRAYPWRWSLALAQATRPGEIDRKTITRITTVRLFFTAGMLPKK